MFDSIRTARLVKSNSGISGPDFICFGLQKAGSRWLFDQLNARTDVWMPPIKDINFFAKDCFKPGNVDILKKVGGTLPMWKSPNDDFKRRVFLDRFGTYDSEKSDINWYNNLFDLKEDKKSGDISPFYCKLNQGEIDFVIESLPSTRFIFLVRDPVERFWSGVNMKVRKGVFPEEQILNWDSLLHLITTDEKLQINSHSARVWKQWEKNLSDERIRFWLFDDIVHQPERIVGEICKFLDIAGGPGKLPPDFNRKKKNTKIAMPLEIRRRLVEFFDHEYTECAKLFGSHANGWLDKQFELLHANR